MWGYTRRPGLVCTVARKHSMACSTALGLLAARCSPRALERVCLLHVLRLHLAPTPDCCFAITVYNTSNRLKLLKRPARQMSKNSTNRAAAEGVRDNDAGRPQRTRKMAYRPAPAQWHDKVFGNVGHHVGLKNVEALGAWQHSPMHAFVLEARFTCVLILASIFVCVLICGLRRMLSLACGATADHRYQQVDAPHLRRVLAEKKWADEAQGQAA